MKGGKSAIMVAVNVGLGGTSKFAGRGSKVQDLITFGENSCSIRLHLANSAGGDPYDFATYGETIIVERRIKRNPDSQAYTIFGVKNGKPVRVSNKKADLELILEHLNIQINNPVSVLMQETSKSLLRDAKPRQLYEFFSLATQLTQIKAEFARISTASNDMTVVLQGKAAQLPEVQRKVEELEEEHQALQKFREMKRQLGVAKAQLAWAMVLDKEAAVAQREGAVAKLTAILLKRESVEQHGEERLVECNRQMEAATRRLDELGRRAKEQDGVVLQAQKRASEANNARRAAEGRMRTIESAKQKKTERRRANQKQRDDTAASLRAANQGDLDSRDAEKRHLQGKIEAQQAAWEEKRSRATALRAEAAQADGRVKELREAVRRQRSRLSKTEQELAAAGRSGAANWGPGSQVKAELERKRKVAGRDYVGPLGAYVMVKEQRYAKQLESVLRDHLTSFLAPKGQNTTEVVNEAVKGKVQIAVTQFRSQSYQIPADRLPEAKYTTAYKLLEFSDPNAEMAFINQANVERTILFDTVKEAQQTFERAPKRQLTNVTVAHGADQNYWVESKNGSIVSRPGATGADLRGVFLSNEEQKLELQRTRDELRQAVEQAEAEAEAEAKRKSELEAQASSLNRECGRMDTEIDRMRRDLDRLDAEIDQSAKKPLDLIDMDRALEELDRDIEGLAKELAEAQEEFKKANEAIGPMKAAYEAAKAETTELKEKLDQVDQEIGQINAQIQKQEEKRLSWEARKAHVEGQIRVENEKLEREKDELAGMLAQAETVMERPALEHECAYYERQITSLERAVAKEQSGRRDDQAVAQELASAQAHYSRTRTALETLEKLSSKLQQALQMRLKKWYSIRRRLTVFCNWVFANLLQRRGFTGTLNFNTKELGKEELSISINMLASGRDTSDMRTLSGGEKSFSTVSLLLSMWAGMESPVRAMDEFDVYMDSVNRNVSLRLVLEQCRALGGQYIFCTPIDLNAFINATDVKVFRLHAPVRGGGRQQALHEVPDTQPV